MNHFLDLWPIPASELRSILDSAKSRKQARKEGRYAPNQETVHSVLKFRQLAGIVWTSQATGNVAAKAVRSQRRQHQIKSRQEN